MAVPEPQFGTDSMVPYSGGPARGIHIITMQNQSNIIMLCSGLHEIVA